MVRDVHDHPHVVLDQHHRRPELVVHVEDEAGHVLLLLEVHPRRRLVEEQHLGLHRQRPRELHPLLQAVGELPDRGAADGLDLEEVDDALDELPMPDLLLLRGAEVQGVGEEAVLHLEQAAGHDVVEGAHAPEQGDVLERPGEAEPRDLEGLEMGPVLPLEQDAPARRPVEPADHVQHRGLAGAVRPDDREHLPGMHREADVVERGDPAEAEQDVLDLQERFRGRGPGRLVALAHVGDGEERRVARLEQVGAELRAPGVGPDRFAHLHVPAEPDGAEPVGDVRALAAFGERGPRLGRDLAALVVDEEVPARAGLAEPGLDLVVEGVDVGGAAEGHAGEIDFEDLPALVERDPLRRRPLVHRRASPWPAGISSPSPSGRGTPWPRRSSSPR